MDQEKVWDEIASEWKEFRVETPTEVVDFLDGKTVKMLDVGCCSGRNFVKQKGLNLYGVDFSTEMLKYARERAEKIGVEVYLEKATCVSLPFEDEFFDHVLLYAVVHCVEEEKKRRKTLEEVYRVLKSGGTAFVCVWGKNCSKLKNKKKEDFVNWGGVKRFNYIYDLEELRDLLVDVGFEIVRSWEDENVCFEVRKGN